jgi:hypothetical protein
MRTRIDKDGIVWVEPEQVGIDSIRLALEAKPRFEGTGTPYSMNYVHDSVVIDIQGSAVDFNLRALSAMREWLNEENYPHVPTEVEIDWEKVSWRDWTAD